MNLSSTTIKKTCDLKCQFSFDYPILSHLQGANMHVTLQLYNGPMNSMTPVKLNDIGYNFFLASFVNPSIHEFNGKKVDGEMIIEHRSQYNKKLMIYIPIVNINVTRPAVLHNILEEIADLQSPGFTKLSIQNFTLNEFVPSHAPFYFSEGTEEISIIFGLENALTLSNEDMNTYTKLIMKTNLPLPKGTLEENTFRNIQGSNMVGQKGEDGNFMECQQYSEEEIPSTSPSASASSSLSTTASSSHSRFSWKDFFFPTKGGKLSKVAMALWIVFYVLLGLAVGFLVIKIIQGPNN